MLPPKCAYKRIWCEFLKRLQRCRTENVSVAAECVAGLSCRNQPEWLRSGMTLRRTKTTQQQRQLILADRCAFLWMAVSR
jgi:hypothetical protein